MRVFFFLLCVLFAQQVAESISRKHFLDTGQFLKKEKKYEKAIEALNFFLEAEPEHMVGLKNKSRPRRRWMQATIQLRLLPVA